MFKRFFPILVLSLAGLACSAPTQSQKIQIEFQTGILAGEPVSSNDEIANSTVAIEAPGYGVYCAGVLIAPNLVVTAAHCTGIVTRPTLLQIVFGLDLTPAAERRQVLGGRVSPLWPQLAPKQTTNWGDIALLRFDGTLPQGFRPIQLLDSTEALSDGLEIILAGFGVINADTQEDSEKLMKVSVRITDAQFSETEFLISKQDGKGACHGDSGGPAYARIGKDLYLVGVTSRSATIQGALSCLDGSISTSIAAHVDFLKSASEELRSPGFVANEPIQQPQLRPQTSP